ncbi:MAG: HIRAN domain-containing protein [Acidimicrobiales bacterium]|nr:HIRAN domain-containing protein [Acidimicrobiales bacterium]
MSLFRRNRRTGVSAHPEPAKELTVTLCEGSTPLEVVGESYRQDNLWRLVGGFRTEYVREACIAMLIPEDNPHDPNAIAVHISGLMVGYLPRATAAAYRPGLETLMRKHGRLVAVNGHIVGGGPRDDGIGRLGVFLQHDPTDFVVGAPHSAAEPIHVRTGAHSEVDAGGLGWVNSVPDDDVRAIPQLRRLLANETNARERHYMYAQLEHHLYHSRAAFSSALEDYDAVCRDHDAEMDSIRSALVADLGGLPLLELYKQAAIRHQLAHDYEQALWVARARYGHTAINAWTLTGSRNSRTEQTSTDAPSTPSPIRRSRSSRGHLLAR